VEISQLTILQRLGTIYFNGMIKILIKLFMVKLYTESELKQIKRQAITDYLKLRGSKDPKISTTKTPDLIEMVVNEEV
jgi:hypothetical protein